MRAHTLHCTHRKNCIRMDIMQFRHLVGFFLNMRSMQRTARGRHIISIDLVCRVDCADNYSIELHTIALFAASAAVVDWLGALRVRVHGLLLLLAFFIVSCWNMFDK